MMALRHQLRADHDVDAAFLDVAELLAHALERGDEVARQHQDAPVGKQRVRLLLEPLHARAAGDERLRRMAFRAGGRWRRGEAAVMADELALEAVVDQPRVAVRAVEAEAAGAAERERRVAAAIEKQQRLLTALQRGLHDAGKPRRDEAPARRAFALQVDRLDRGLVLPAEALREREPPVAAAPRVHHRLDRRRRRGEHDRNVRDACAHHRHVARVVVHAVFLLVDGVVLLIDHDQAEVRVGQEQRRARADHHVHLARRDRVPGARALACAELRMPFGGPHAEALREAVEELRGERDLRHQDQRLAALADRLGDRLEIDLGLARAGDAVEQVDREAAVRDGAAQDVGRHALRAGQLGLAVAGIGLARDRLGRQRDDFERAFVDEPVDHAGRNAGILGGFGFGAQQTVRERRHHAPARRRHALRRADPKAAPPRARAPAPARPCAAPSAAPCRATPACSSRPSR